MTGAESLIELLASLTGVTEESAEAIYATHFSPVSGEYLEEMVRYKLTANGKTGAAAGEDLLSMLLRNGAGQTATLTTALQSDTPYTALATTALTVAVAVGETLVVDGGPAQLLVTASAASALNATSIAIESVTPTFSYGVGSGVYPGGVPESATQCLLRTGLAGWS